MYFSLLKKIKKKSEFNIKTKRDDEKNDRSGYHIKLIAEFCFVQLFPFSNFEFHIQLSRKFICKFENIYTNDCSIVCVCVCLSLSDIFLKEKISKQEKISGIPIGISIYYFLSFYLFSLSTTKSRI